MVPLRNGRAVGVEYISKGNGNSSYPPSSIIVKASRLVVVSAGAFGSLVILERSGIGFGKDSSTAIKQFVGLVDRTTYLGCYISLDSMRKIFSKIIYWIQIQKFLGAIHICRNKNVQM